MGKIIWILFYIAFVPSLCIRYVSMATGAICNSFFAKNFIQASDDEDDAVKGDVFDAFAKAGYFSIGAALWPIAFLITVVLALLYRIYAYTIMVSSLCAYRSKN